MKKYNWERFYDELEQGDPAKFPYWMFLVRELHTIAYYTAAGFVLGLFLFVGGLFFAGVIMSDKIQQDTSLWVPEVKVFCRGLIAQ